MGTARPLGSRTPNWAVMEHVAMGCHLHTMAGHMAVGCHLCSSGRWWDTWPWVVTDGHPCSWDMGATCQMASIAGGT